MQINSTTAGLEHAIPDPKSDALSIRPRGQHYMTYAMSAQKKTKGLNDEIQELMMKYF